MKLTSHSKKHLLILAGGKGERLWPLSTSDHPKQFLLLEDGKSLFKETIARHLGMVDTISILTLEKYFFSALDQLEAFSGIEAHFFLEPMPKGTLPILLITLLALDPNDFFLMTPSDLLIKDLIGYRNFLIELFDKKEGFSACLVGKKPAFAHTGFGYILHQDHQVLSFIEKPDLALAESLIASKKVLWNCGMIYAKVGDFLNLAASQVPVTLNLCKKIYSRKKQIKGFKDIFRFDPLVYNELLQASIDRALLEKVKDLAVQEAFFDWKDLGSIPAMTSCFQNPSNVTCLNSTNIQVEGNKKDLIIQNLDGITIFENEKQIFILKS